MKNQTFSIPPLLFGFLLVGCTTVISPPPISIEADTSISLPITIEKVWYRTGKVRLTGLAYEGTGAITVSETSVLFKHDKGEVNIPSENIQKVDWGKLSPDITNDWVIVFYSKAGKEEVAAFKGALLSGGGKDSKIYSALLKTTKAQ